MLNRLFVVDSVTLTSTGTAVSSYTPWDQTTRKLPTQVVVKATGQGAYVRLSNDNSAATNADVLVQGGDHVVLSVQGRRWVSVLSDGASSTVNVGALSTGVSGSAASLDLAFVDAGVLDPRVTFTRTGTNATYFNSAGVLTSAGADVPRFDYDPATLAAQGLLIEEQRTNSIRNNTMQGAVAGTPGTLPTNWTILGGGIGTLTQQVVGTGTSNGINYIDYRVSGTTSTTGFTLSFEQNAQIVAANGQTWASSAWVALIGGSTTNITTMNLTIDGRTAAGSFVGVVNNLNLLGVTPTLTRYTNSGTIANASIERVVLGIAFIFNSGVAIDITLRIGLPQLELGAFATSVIPTTTTALTRSADVASVNTLSPWYNATAGTLYAEYQTYSASTAQIAVSLMDSGGSSNRATVGQSTTAYNGAMVDGGAVQASLTQGTSSTNVVKNAFAFAVNDFAFSVNGAAPVTDTLGTVSSAFTEMQLGKRGSTSPLSGYLRRITYYPRKLSSAELQAITA